MFTVLKVLSYQKILPDTYKFVWVYDSNSFHVSFFHLKRDGHAERQTDRQTDMQKDRQTDRQTTAGTDSQTVRRRILNLEGGTKELKVLVLSYYFAGVG